MIPKIGMTFISEDEVRNFYKSYAQNVGFGISKLGGKKGDDGKQKYFCFGCAKSGKIVSQAKNALYPRPSTKTNCKAKINVAIQNDDNFVISSVSLDHNHILSPGKSRHFRFEAGGYENLTFDERKYRNYISEARRLRFLHVQAFGVAIDSSSGLSGAKKLWMPFFSQACTSYANLGFFTATFPACTAAPPENWIEHLLCTAALPMLSGYYHMLSGYFMRTGLAILSGMQNK
ncbi:hypothetical protein ZIOFF_018615 [Zingiber officinale]|uniref:FAR1 domain-containing protein n=1 Tax=Zingiber officinale TaxID=94328 RepID=A0A8J5H8H1_ZINOF|nr:hypothetical protein ZIOFF_018615 [Zingiber officinale]